MTPQAAGFVRAPDFDTFCRRQPGWEVWRTPENVLVALPPGCTEVELTEVKSPRGVTLAVTKPDGAFTLWPVGKKKDAQ